MTGDGPVLSPGVAVTVGAVLGGRYRLDAVAGRGGMATVFRARDAKHDRDVAIKVLDRVRLTASDAARFDGEIEALAKLQHPHVLPLLDSGDVDGVRFLVTPFVAGESLGRRLAREGRLPIDESIRLARQVASALAHAHALGVIHRDITPGNILLSNGLAVVADFGIARLADLPAGVMTETGITIGTPAYMSPEQASGDRQLDARSDVYALGCVLYAMLTGAAPFSELSAQLSLTRRMLEGPPPPSSRRADVPPDLDAVVTRALAPLAEGRWPSAAAFEAALADVEIDVASASRPRAALPPPARPTRPPRRRTGLVWGSAAVVAAALLAVLGWRATRTPRLDASVVAVLRRPAQPVPTAALVAALGGWRDVVVREIDGAPPEGDAAAREATADARAGVIAWAEAARDASGAAAVRVQAIAVEGDAVVRRSGLVALRDDAATATRVALDSALGLAIDPRLGVATSASLAARRALARAEAARLRWALDEAVPALREALAADSLLVPARFALAEALVWLGDSTRAEAGDAVERLAGVQARLAGTTQASARALIALGRGDLPAACGQYRALVAGDSLDARAWVGLALCQQRDSTVVRSASSPSGWAFRTSWWRAREAMERALALDPDAHHVFGYPWFARGLLSTTAMLLRPGQGEGGSAFGAFVTVEGDTTGFIPWSYPQLQQGSSRVVGDRVAPALDGNRRRLLALAAAVRRARPSSADANEGYALALENVGELGDAAAGGAGGIDGAISAALAASRSDEQRFRLGALRVRVALKRGAYAVAGRIADSLADAGRTIRAPEHLRTRSALYALVGRAALAADAARAAADAGSLTTSRGPSALRHATARLVTFAATGPVDSIRASHAAVQRELDRWVAPGGQREWVDRELAQPAMLAADALGGLPDWAPGFAASTRGQLLSAAHRGDRERTVRLHESLLALRATLRPAEVSLDAVLAEARALALVGEQRRAVPMVDAALEALPARDALLLDAPTTASLVQLMRIRHALEPTSAVAARWKAAADTLWRVVAAR